VTSVVLIVGTDVAKRSGLVRALEGVGYLCTSSSFETAAAAYERRQPRVVVVMASDASTAEALACVRLLSHGPARACCLFVAQTSSEGLAIAAFRAGAQHYVKEPSTVEVLRAAIDELHPGGSESERDAEPSLAGGDQLVGRSEAMRSLRARIKLIAPVSSNVLILGETGTGKELVAELLHRNGPRSTRPFICINTAAIPDSLLENELFGHERGAFTGATSNQVGKLAAANGGTLFLDEIGDVSLPVQAKLLRAIENKVLHRLGGTDSIRFDARIVSATNTNLEQAASDGRFRQDLYYRLNVVRVELPPLRDRVDDIPQLVVHYLQRFNKELGRSVRGLSQGAMDTLCAYRWPGNVRELRNVIEALLVNLAPETRGIVDVPPEVMRQLATAMRAPASERERLLSALTATNWNKSRAARQLRCSRMTLYRKMEQHKVAR
jgi:DNA-binding NtrC family response regulator